MCRKHYFDHTLTDEEKNKMQHNNPGVFTTICSEAACRVGGDNTMF